MQDHPPFQNHVIYMMQITSGVKYLVIYGKKLRELPRVFYLPNSVEGRGLLRISEILPTVPVLSDRGWNLTPPLYYFIFKKQFFKYTLAKLLNAIKEQLEQVI